MYVDKINNCPTSQKCDGRQVNFEIQYGMLYNFMSSNPDNFQKASKSIKYTHSCQYK